MCALPAVPSSVIVVLSNHFFFVWDVPDNAAAARSAR
jgi:hypothetical protein